ASVGSTSCTGGTVTAAPGNPNISFSGGSLAASATCAVMLSITATDTGWKTFTSGPITSNEAGSGPTATASITVGDVFWTNYVANLSAGDSFLNITNTASV